MILQTLIKSADSLTHKFKLHGKIVAILSHLSIKIYPMLSFKKFTIAFLTITFFVFNQNTFAANVHSDSNELSAPADLNEFFSNSNTFFGKYVSNGKVDYALIGKQKAELVTLINMIEKADVSKADKNTKTAFYLNAYNLLTINSVVMNMPIKSPLDVKGFFDAKPHNIAGNMITLNDIENKFLRPDPRVHFALVCAAIGCPKLMSEAYMPDKVQTQLINQTKKAMNDASFIKVDDSAKTVAISQLFDWYKDDFVNNTGTVINFINKFRNTPIPADYTITFYNYDWNLNIK